MLKFQVEIKLNIQTLLLLDGINRMQINPMSSYTISSPDGVQQLFTYRFLS